MASFIRFVEKDRGRGVKCIATLACEHGGLDVLNTVMERYVQFLDLDGDELKGVSQWAAMLGRRDCLDVLIRRHGKRIIHTFNLIHFAVQSAPRPGMDNAKFETLEYLVSKNPRGLGKRNDRGYTSLYLAIRDGTVRMVELLAGRPELKGVTNDDGQDPIYCAFAAKPSHWGNEMFPILGHSLYEDHALFLDRECKIRKLLRAGFQIEMGDKPQNPLRGVLDQYHCTYPFLSW
jgi:hypothetical protein